MRRLNGSSIPLHHVKETMDEILTESSAHHSCIQASLMLEQLLQLSGHEDTFAMTVSLEILPPKAKKWLQEHSSSFALNTDPTFFQECHVRRCQFSGPVNSKQWAGHLVVIIPRYFEPDHAMCDLTITQFDDPEDGILLTPIWLQRVKESFVRGESHEIVEVNKSIAFYTAHPNDDTFKDSDGTMRSEGFDVWLAFGKAKLNAHVDA